MPYRFKFKKIYIVFNLKRMLPGALFYSSKFCLLPCKCNIRGITGIYMCRSKLIININFTKTFVLPLEESYC